MIQKSDIELYKRIAKEQGYEVYKEGNELFFFHPKDMYIKIPTTKRGKPDMRYSVNKLKRMLERR
jgi:hypothetical protein